MLGGCGMLGGCVAVFLVGGAISAGKVGGVVWLRLLLTWAGR